MGRRRARGAGAVARQGGLRSPCRPAATRRPVRSAQDHSSQQHGPQQPPFAACGLSTGAVGSHTTVARQLRPEVDGWAEELSGRQKEAARHLLRDLRRDQVARHAPCSPLPAPTSAAHSPGLSPWAGPGCAQVTPAGRGAGCQHGLRTSRGGAAPSSARRNPRQQQGGRPPSRSGRSSGGSGLDRPF